MESKTISDTRFIIPEGSRTDDTFRNKFIRDLNKRHRCPKCGHQWDVNREFNTRICKFNKMSDWKR